jgi:hypothetical protein
MRRLLLAALFALVLSPADAQNVTDSKTFSNISATTAPFNLKGGNYQVCAVATFGGGSVKLETLGPDGSTYLPVNSATSLSANGCGNTYAAPGQFEIVIATATAVYVSVAAIPQ